MAKSKRSVPDGALPKEQQWAVEFLNDAVTSEYKALSPGLKKAFWALHDKIRFQGLPTLTKKEAQRLSGTKDMWELRFKGKGGIGRGLYVQRIGRKIVVLVFFEKKAGKLPKRMLDLATERRKTLEEVIVEALNMKEGMAAKPINALDVYDEEYPSGSKKREEMDAWLDARLAERVRKRQRIDRIRALPKKAKEKLVRALGKRRVHGQKQAAG